MTERYDTVVVGGGIAGLVAAATAAEAGARVAVVEGRALGGRARTTERDGFRFNQGAHALYEAGALAAACRRLGVVATGGAPAIGQAGVLWQGAVHALSDGGPDRHAARRPVVSPERVARLVLNLAKRPDRHRATAELVWVNGGVGLLVGVDGRPLLTQSFEFDGEQISGIAIVVNPRKLAALERSVELI